MLPISLKFEGLNSYAQEVFIDFTKFYKTRLFGIFGDTGAGKSTILDAIILSIYGETPRLSQNVKEAINPFRKAINLEFSFSILGEKYLITRNITSESSKIKLYQIKEGRKIPLAEGKKEFNEKIKKIIGLTSKEFSKIVILPQNQFAELLKIAPAERAVIIGNIFDLNYLGEPLYERFSFKVSELDKKLAEKQHRLSMLKDISEENIKNKEREIEGLIKSLHTLNKKYVEISERLNLIKTLIQLGKDKEKIEREIQEIESKKSEIEEIEKKIKIDEELQPYKTFFEELKTLETNIKEHQQQKEKLSKEFENLEIKLKQLTKEYETFEKHFIKRLKELTQIISEANHYIELAKEIDNLKKQKEQKSKELVQNRKSLKDIEEEIKKIEKEIAEITKEIEKQNKLLRGYQLTEEESNLYEILPKALSKINELKNLKAEIEKLYNNLTKERKKEDSIFKKLQNLAKERFNLTITNYEEIEKAIENKEKKLKAHLEDAKKQLEDLNIKNLAFTLSKKLYRGKPCPVCGSTEHPNPATSVDEEDIKSTEKTVISTEEELKKLEHFKSEIRPDLTLLIKTKTNIEGYERSIQEKKVESATVEKELLDILPKKYWENAEEIFNALKERKKEADRLTKSLNELNINLNEKNNLKNIQIQQQTKTETYLEQINVQIKELDRQISEKEQILIKYTGGKNPTEIKKESETELENLEKKKTEYEKNIKKYEEEKQKDHIELEKIKNILSEEEKRYREILKILEEQANKRDVSVEELKGLILNEETKNTYKTYVESYYREYNRAKGAWENIKKRLEELPIKEASYDEPQRLEEELKTLNTEIAQLNEKKGALMEQIKTEVEMLKEKNTINEEVKELENLFENLRLLKNLTEGKAMVKFVSWYLLKDIVKLTNQILRELIGRRFIVNVTSNLDFTITDLYYNKERPVNTLSGGEVFLVSFALALALSNYIQNKRKRAIQFFFIDEGFSSLDKDLLDSVCAVLNELRSQDRLVGLISHIAELKQVIPQSIYVRRDSTGSSIIDF